MDTNNTYLHIENLYKYFDQFPALKDISLDIAEGEFVCFLGPSGCGKTTLLRAIAGLDKQSEGRIFINGEDVSDWPPAIRDFGIVFQNYALFPNLSVKDNISFGMRGQGLKKKHIKARVKELLDKVGLPEQSKKFPKELSGGQQQRVALARALARSPSMLLLDEPLSALDAKVRAHLRQEIKSLQRDLGVTTIMVTHDQEEALTMADRIVLMRDGKVEQVGTPEELYSQPINSFVANFIGEMNFLPALRIGDNLAKVGNVELSFDGRRAQNDEKELTLAIRPEDIWVKKRDAREENTLNTMINDSEYLGPLMRMTMSGGDLQSRSVRADIAMNLVRQMSLGNGSSLPITFPIEQLLVFNDQAKLK